jgi:hypothetical protein
MASFDDLPADQQAVLSMVLKQGRNFDQIAAMLNVDRAGIRQRALEGFDALGPDTTLVPLKRALITDYLLGQLPPAVARNVANSLADSPPERAWARIIAAEIAPLAAHGMPEIPAAGSKSAAAPTAVADPAPTQTDSPAVARRRSGSAVPALGAASGAAPAGPASGPAAPAALPAAGLPPSSRRGGAILIGVITIVVVIVVVILVATSGSSKKHRTANTPSTTGPQVTASTGTGTNAVKPIHTISMVSASGSKTIKGGADVVRDAGQLGLVILGEGLPANTKNAYGVWLYDSKTKASKFLGFYGQKVAATGKAKGILEAEVKLPSGATAYNELLLTLETVEKPTTPGTIVLEGVFAE